MKSKFVPKYKPSSSYTDAVLGRVEVYTCKIKPTADGTAQAWFTSNGARANLRTQYGLKFFPTLSQAFAAYQRQKIAAAAGAAPPVRCMVKYEPPCWCNKKNCAGEVHIVQAQWGYQTSIASYVGRSGEVDYDYESWFHENRLNKTKYPPKWVGSEKIRDLLNKMRLLTIVGTQSDHEDFGKKRRRNIPMIHDLHIMNIGRWKGNPVVIDFGYHIVQDS